MSSMFVHFGLFDQNHLTVLHAGGRETPVAWLWLVRDLILGVYLPRVHQQQG